MGKKRAFIFFYLLTTFSFFSMQAQTVIPLYDGEVPNSRPAPDKENSRYEQDSILIVSKVSRPTLTLFFLPKKKRRAPQ